MKKLWLAALLGMVCFGTTAMAQDNTPANDDPVIKLAPDEKWEQVDEDQEMTVYILTPIEDLRELREDGMIIRVRKKNPEDIAFQVKPDCQQQRLYITAGMDLAKNGKEVKEFQILPASKDSVLDASQPGSGYRKVLEMMCGDHLAK
ncbi:MAG: hypothetical protein J5492_02060 [Oxalobacter sp.]|jgi:hypothetical protein|nr:hypothetical protein [Oxalobacter sp.]